MMALFFSWLAAKQEGAGIVIVGLYAGLSIYDVIIGFKILTNVFKYEKNYMQFVTNLMDINEKEGFENKEFN
jgi:hypothetical protein